jgi:hypothetical protein
MFNDRVGDMLNFCLYSIPVSLKQKRFGSGRSIYCDSALRVVSGRGPMFGHTQQESSNGSEMLDESY